MESTVSLSISILALIITSDMITPKIPSRDMCQNIDIIAAINVDNDRIASKNASLPDATSACEFISSPTFFTYFPSPIFTTTATAMIISETVVYDVASGWNILGHDSMNAVIPAQRTIAAIITDEKYSIRPYPYGWFLSGAFPANLVPMMVMMDESASVKLLTASKVMAIEFTRIPIVALKATSIRFTTMPIILVLMIFSSLVMIKYIF